MESRKALGRGLSALIPDLLTTKPSSPKQAARMIQTEKASDDVRSNPIPLELTSSPEFFHCGLEEIAPSPDNPRQYYDENRLLELSDSIRAQGLIQPLVVRKRLEKEQLAAQVRFVLIAGERRWRASQRAGLTKVPIVVKEVSTDQAFELALVENLQREDLNPIEEAEGYKRLSDEFGYTQEKLAERVGRARETVANSLRLLRLPAPIQQMVVRTELSMGHARALLSLDNPDLIEQLARQVAIKQLSVRQTEEFVRRTRRKVALGQIEQGTASKSPLLLDVEEQLQKAFHTRVRVVTRTPNSGRIELEYQSLDQFEQLLQQLTQVKAELIPPASKKKSSKSFTNL